MECPITLCKIQTPVIAQDGYVYEAEAISRWFETHKTSPITGLVLESTILYPLYSNLNLNDNKENKDDVPDTHLKDIIREQKDRIIAFDQERESMRGILKHMSENFAKQVTESTSERIQHYVEAMIDSYDNENTLKVLRGKLDDILKRENIIQLPSDNLLNFSCLPLRNMSIRGNGQSFDLRCSDLRNVKFYGDTSTGGCIHGNYSWSDITGSIAMNDFCTKQSNYTGTCMINAILTGYNTGCNSYDGAITIRAQIRQNNVLKSFTCEKTISLPEHLISLCELKKKFK